MTLAGEGRDPGRAHLLRLAENAGISPSHAQAIIEEAQTAVAGWRRFAAEAGVSKAGQVQVARSLHT